MPLSFQNKIRPVATDTGVTDTSKLSFASKIKPATQPTLPLETGGGSVLETANASSAENLAKIKKVVGGAVSYLSDTQAMKDWATRLNEYKEKTGQESREGKALAFATNFLKGISSVSPSDIPFYGGAVYDLTQITKFNDTAKKLKAGEVVPREEIEWANEFIKSKDEEAKRTKDEFGYEAGSIVRGSIGFGIELAGASLFVPPGAQAVTLSALFAKKASLKAAKEVAEKLLFDKTVRSAVSKELGRYATRAGITVGIAGAPKIPANTLERMVGTPITNEQGDFIGLTDDGQSLPEAFINATTEQLVEIGTEYTGGGFSILGKGIKEGLIKAGILKATIKANPSIRPEILQNILKRVGWHGIIQEWGEERVGDVLYGVLHDMGLSDQDFKPVTLESTINELTAFGFMGALINATENSLKPSKKQKGEAPTEKDPVDELVTDVRTQIDAGASPTEVALSLSQEMPAATAEAVVKEAVFEAVKEATTQKTKEIPKQVEEVVAKEAEKSKKTGAEKAGEELAALSQKVDEKILTKTPQEYAKDLAEADEALTEQTKELREVIKTLEEKVSQAPARSQEKKDLKLKLEAEREKLRVTEEQFQEKIYGNALAFRDFFGEFIKKEYNLDVSEEDLSGMLDEIGMRMTDRAYTEETWKIPVGELAKGVIGEYKKEHGIKETKQTEQITKTITSQALKVGQQVVVKSKEGQIKTTGEVVKLLKNGAIIKDEETNLPMLYKDEAFDFEPKEEATLDKKEKKIEDEDNGKDTKNRRGGADEGGVPETLPLGGKKPGDAGGAIKVSRKRDKDRPTKRGGKLGERLGERLTNEEIEKIVSSVTEISDQKEVKITGEITEEILEAANQYTPGGTAKEGRGILDEYYTESQVVDMVKSLIDFPARNLRILEPSVGTGNFLYAIPEIGNHSVAALEINPTTAKIAKIFHPSARVINEAFEERFIDERGNKKPITMGNMADLIIGNPPYGEHRGKFLGLGEEKGIKKYENYFVKRGLDLLNEDGTLAMVLPSSYLEHKKEIKNAILEVAYRLPEGIFKGTQIGTDIVVLKKKAKAVSKLAGYFDDNSSNILGEVKERKNRFGKQEKYVSGDLESAQVLFEQHRNDSKAKTILKDLKIEPTAENIEEISETIEEAGKGAEEIVKEEQKAEKRLGKKTIQKKVVKEAVKKKDEIAPLTEQFVGVPESELALWRKTNARGYVENPTEEEKELLNFMSGQWYLDFNYLQGDIYEKLAFAKSDLSDNKTQYEKQRAKLEAVLPLPEKMDDIKISPNHTFVSELKMGEVDGEETTLRSRFLAWLQTLPHQAFGDSSNWEVREYVNNEIVRGTDKDRNELIRVRRKNMAESLFGKYLREELEDEDRRYVEDTYNRTYNFYHSPDYSKVPMFSSIYTSFGGNNFRLNEAQREGIGRLVNRGVGLLAHEVGFGKTISGVLSAYETMQRGWAKRPVIIVPNDNVYTQWAKTIRELVPNAQLNLLGNLGVSYKGDLSSLKIDEGSFTLLTYEGLKRLSFKDETYASMAGKFSYISDDLTAHKTKRGEAKQEEVVKGIAGGMKKGTRADLFFEDLGFDYLIFDEVHNANHIVSKAKIEKGQASEFSRFSINPSDLGMKTWLATQYIQEKTNGRNINLLSATPFTNHPLEYYSILSLVADKSLQKMRLQNVNDFFGAFMEANHEYEFKADGSYKPKTDIRRIKNYRQWRNLLGAYIDFKQDAPGIQRPNRVQVTYEIPQNDLTRELNTKAQGIFEENDRESGKGAKVLRAINEFRKIAFSPYASKFSEEVKPEQYKEIIENSPKLATVMGIVAQNKKDKPEAGQIIYSEVGVEFFPLLKNYLVKVVGFKSEEVEIISGKTAKPTRMSIQDSFNAGKVKILIGSEAISEGMNLQENTADMHLLSLPWNFTALRQVIGRAWRQGNSWANVRINQYFIQDSIDIFLSQKLDNKQRRYEAAIASNANEVDVGDVSYNEMKSELIQDPEKRAKFEIEGEKEQLKADIIQAQAELAFTTRKLEKINNLMESIKDDTELLTEERKKAEPQEFWISRYEKDIKNNKKDLAEEIAKLKAKDIDVDTLLQKRKEGEKHIAELEAKVKAIEETYDTRVKEIVATLPKRQLFSKDTLDKFIAERAEHNKTFYETAETPTEETIKVEKQVKEIKNAAGTKVVKKKTIIKAVKTRKEAVRREGATRDERVLKILSDNSLNVSQKVGEILNVKQEGKEFKDIGDRVAGSKKERAAINTVLENGDAGVIAEMIKTLGADAIAETLHKDEILENAVKPDVEKDKAEKVPAFITGWKQKVFNSISRTPTLVSKEGRYGTMQYVPNEVMLPFLMNYGDYLRTFAKELADVKTYEQAQGFHEKYRWRFVDSIKPTVTDPQQPDYAPDASIGILGRTIKSALDGISTYRYVLTNIEETKKILESGVQKENFSGKTHYQGLSDWGTGTSWFDTKAKAEKSTDIHRTENEEWLKKEEERLKNNYDYYLPKRKAPTEDTDLSHGNFKPLDHVERSEADIPDSKINPETLTKEMGFKSVQLGNYMDDPTAKEHIRYTIGAIKDMSKLLAIDFPALMNKMGLSIAFGARGGGRFNAHYEPSHNIINLTKGRGDGSFFHEFIHFLDWTTNKGGYRKKWSGGKEKWWRGDDLDSATFELTKALTGERIRKVKEFTPRDDASVLDDKENWVMRARANGESFESVLATAKRSEYPGRMFQDVADVYRQTVKEETQVYNEDTEFYKNAKTLGGGKADAYWVRPHELLARAGQAYIEDKMKEAGMKNNYLTREISEDSKAYPQGEERKIFNTYFDKVFAELSKRYPLEKAVEGELPSEARFKISDILYEKPEVKMTEAGKYLADVKKRLNLDFDVHFVDAILAGYETGLITRKKTPIEAWGVTSDNTIVLAKEIARHTAPHEIVHLTLQNMGKIPIFKRNGITRGKVMQAKATQMGLELNKENASKIDEQLALDFEKYLDEKHLPKGIIRKFFAILRREIMRFARAIVGTKSDITKDYYDILDEGVALESEYVEIENNGIMEAFIEEVDGGVLDFDKIDNGKFKLKEEPDKRTQNLKGRFNDLVNKQSELENNVAAWKTDIIKEIVAKEEAAKLVDETPERITGKFGEPGLIRFTKRTPPVGELTDRGIEEVESLGFANMEEAQQEINAYLQRKTQLISTRNQLRTLRRQIAQASRDKKLNKSVLRDIERKLKMRKRFLEQKDYYVGMGVGRGKKEQMKMIHRRSRVIRDIQDQFAIGDVRAKKLIGGFGRQRIHLMTEQQFNDFTVEFYNRAEALGNQLTAQDEAKALIAENQFGKWENLQKAMELPSIEKMTEQQAQSFVEALSAYQFGDIFLTQRELETIHRTNWGDIKTERELLAKMQENMGFDREQLKTLTARNVGEYTPWIRLARKHPFFNWLVGKRVEADIQATREYVKVETEVNKFARAARSSRRKQMGLKEQIIDVAVPTDEIVFGFLEAEDKETYEKKNKMTREEITFAYYLIGQYWNAYEYLNSEYGMSERNNYMTHTRRSFLEAFKQEGLMPAFREVLASQKEEEAAFKILDDETGNTLAFEKFFGYALHRTGALVPSKNVARASLGYFNALAKKRAMDKFVPEALIAVQAHKAVVGTTEKGLTKDPTLEKFVKEFLNNAKGRKIKWLTKQGSASDIALRAGVAWVAIKYLGGNLASAIGNVMGYFTAIFWELNLREQATGITRSILHPIQAHEINQQFRFFTGRNPIVELFDPKYNLPERLKRSLMVLMGIGAFQSNKFFLRAKMSDEEFKTGVIEDKRLVEIANSLSRVKPNQFYVKSLAGNTTAGNATFQFGTWAVAITNTILSDGQEVVKMLAERDVKKALTSREAQKLLKFAIMAGILLWLTYLISVDDDDYTLWGRTIRSIRNNLNTLVQALQFTTDITNYGLIIKEVILWGTALKQLFTQEEYKQDGKGYKIGDPKWIRTGERIITPNALRQFFPDVKESAKESLIQEAIKGGVFDAEGIAKAISPDWDDPEKMDEEAKKRKIESVKMLYAVRKNYPNNPLVEIILNTVDKNEEKVQKMIEYGKEVGNDTVYSELKELYRDSEICGDPRKRTGCLVSGKLLKEYVIAQRKL